MTPNLVTPERAKEIEERLGRATPGPWNWSWGDLHYEGKTMLLALCQGAERPESIVLEAYKWAENLTAMRGADGDANLIAHSWEDLRDLLHTLAVEREESARLRGLFTEERHDATEPQDEHPCDWYTISGEAYRAALSPRGEEGKHGGR